MSSPLNHAERHWDDVQVGDRIEGFEMNLTWTAMALQVSGSQDWNLVHHDVDYAQNSGHPSPFFNTGWTAAMLGRTVSDWIGPSGWMRRLSFEMRKMNRLGDTVSTGGLVVAKERTSDGHFVANLELWLRNDREGVTTPAKAVVELPRKSGSRTE